MIALSSDVIKSAVTRNLFTVKRQISFIDDLLVWLTQGASLGVALDVQIHAAVDRRQRIEKLVAQDIKASLDRGEMLDKAMGRWFNPGIVTMVGVGLKSGQLSAVVNLQKEFWQQRGELLGNSLKKLSYPLILFLVSLLATVIIGQGILPKFMTLDSSIQWTADIRLLSDLSGFIGAWGLYILALIVAGIIACVSLLPEWQSPTRRKLDSLGILTLYRTYAGVLLLQNLSILMAGRLNLESSCRLLVTGSNPYLRWHLQQIRNKLSHGVTDLGQLLDSGLLDSSTLFKLRTRLRSTGKTAELMRVLSEDLATEAKFQFWYKLKGGVLLLYTLSVLFIVLIVISMGNVLTTLAGQWT